MKTRVIQDGLSPNREPIAPDPTPPGTRRSWVKRHPKITFFTLTYLIGWGGLPFNSFGAYSPLVAAAIVIALTEGRRGFRRWGLRLVRWRVGWQWYAAAMALPLGTLAISSGLNMALGAPQPSTSQFSPWYAVLMAFGLNMVSPIGGPLGEEPGWRGFAQPGLQHGRSPLTATSILAVLVTIWHLPLLLPAFGLRPIDLLSTVAVTFWYAWLFNRSAGSVLLTLIAHSIEGSIQTSGLWSGADGARLSTLWALTASAEVLAIIIGDWRFWRRPSQIPQGTGKVQRQPPIPTT